MDITKPGVQKPHCDPWARAIRSWGERGTCYEVMWLEAICTTTVNTIKY